MEDQESSVSSFLETNQQTITTLRSASSNSNNNNDNQDDEEIISQPTATPPTPTPTTPLRRSSSFHQQARRMLTMEDRSNSRTDDIPAIGMDPTFDSDQSSDDYALQQLDDFDDLEAAAGLSSLPPLPSPPLHVSTPKQQQQQQQQKLKSSQSSPRRSDSTVSKHESGKAPPRRSDSTVSKHESGKATELPAQERKDSGNSWLDSIETFVYIGVFAMLGTILRVYMGRFFGLDCGKFGEGTGDFFTSISTNICVTDSGKTHQVGGALFIDLPANILGSFIMGILSPAKSGQPIVWLRPDHPLQRHKAFHNALGTGFCGSLTTFASWNTQMVVMLDGTDTVVGPQIASALFGYLIGTMCAVCSFIAGRHANEGWSLIHKTARLDEVDIERLARTELLNQNTSSCKRTGCFLCSLPVASFWLSTGLLAAFVVGDAYFQIPFYRKMWLSMLMAPIGANLRYRLKRLNAMKGPIQSLEWVPWGTLICNLSACCISVIAEAAVASYAMSGGFARYDWMSTALPAVLAGFSGTLSTVSTWAKEIVEMKQTSWMYLYSFGSLSLAMLLSLALYSPIIRSGGY